MFQIILGIQPLVFGVFSVLFWRPLKDHELGEETLRSLRDRPKIQGGGMGIWGGWPVWYI